MRRHLGSTLDQKSVRYAGKAVEIQSLESRRLLAAPAIAWSSYIGGDGIDHATSVVTDAAGYVYVAGATGSPGWVKGGYDTSFNGGGRDAFVMKISPAGKVVWSTYVGGTGWDTNYYEYDHDVDLAVDRSGNIYLTGQTRSPKLAKDGFDTSLNGSSDAFVAKISGSGKLLWLSYLGGNSEDLPKAIAVDSSGNIFITGWTKSTDFGNQGADLLYGGYEDGFLAKINADGTFAWSTYVGGADGDACMDVAVDASGSVYVTGYTYSDRWISGGFDLTPAGYSDAFVAKYNTNGSLTWSTYLGGGGATNNDRGTGIAVDPSGNVYISGWTASASFASGGYDNSYNGSFDAFVARINANGSFAWSTYLGGSGIEGGSYVGFDTYVTTDRAGNVYVTGNTTSANWMSGGFDTSYNGSKDAFVARINADGTFSWGSYIGGSGGWDLGYGIAVDSAGNIYVAGLTQDNGWAKGGFDTTNTHPNFNEGFLVKIVRGAPSQAPNGLTLSANTVEENKKAGTVVGTLTGSAPTSGSTFTYSLVSGTGSTNNSLFTISGNQLKTRAAFNYEAKRSYSIRVQVKDKAGLTYQKQLTIGVLDVPEPLVIKGTDANNTITLSMVNGKVRVKVGTSVKDYDPSTLTTISVYGLGGNDRITVGLTDIGVMVDGGAGADTITGGAANDRLLGGTGNDRIYGKDGNDTIRGGTGNDTIDGGNGDDQLYGDDNNDSLIGGAGADLLYGGIGDDWLLVRDGEVDTVYGDAGRDKAQIDDGVDIRTTVESLLA